MSAREIAPDSVFELYDLRVELVAPAGAKLWCGGKVGDWFELRGEMLHLPPGQGFSIYSLAAVLPLLAAKQRATAPGDWMSTDAEVACPDPNCPSRLRITRLGKRRFDHAATTAVPMAPFPDPGVAADRAGADERTDPARAAPAAAVGATAAATDAAAAAADDPPVERPMIPRTTLPHGHDISRLIKGGWHLAGDHGPVDPMQAADDMAAFIDGGVTTFDCADIYTNVEQMIGDFRRAHPDHARRLRVHTKFVPNLSDLATLDATAIEATIDRSLVRLGVERLDLVQFHWWDFAIAGHVDAALHLTRLKAKGKVANVAVTNYDTPHLAELVDAGVPVIAHQLQYSLLDDRPRGPMLDYCRDHDIAFLCYGTVAGGFLSDRWLGRPEPTSLVNRSLIKYRLIIEDFGGWTLFQQLLRTLRGVADRHGCDIATVATRAVLDRPNVAAAIVGATNASHLDAHRRLGGVTLDATDLAAIDAVTSHRQGPHGDPYDLERDRDGRHGRIMKYELQ